MSFLSGVIRISITSCKNQNFVKITGRCSPQLLSVTKSICVAFRREYSVPNEGIVSSVYSAASITDETLIQHIWKDLHLYRDKVAVVST